MDKITIYTIGFTKKKAEYFFETLCGTKARRLIDIRLNNVSQLAGYAKRDDLKYFLRKICGIEYEHIPELAPTDDILDDYKKKIIDWNGYEKRFNALLEERKIEERYQRALFDNAVLLCSEHEPDNCHRRLVAEFLKKKWGGIEIRHLT